MSRNRILGVFGMIGGLLGILLSVAFAATGWGEPGTDAYRIYETLNRITSLALLLIAGGWLGLTFSLPSGYGRKAVWVAFIASIAMLIGNAAEFWFFTDQPYGDSTNARSISWSAYSLGSLFQTMGATAIGIYGWRTGLWSKAGSLVLVMALPIEILAFIFGLPFVGPAMLAMTVGWILLSSSIRIGIFNRNSVSTMP